MILLVRRLVAYGAGQADREPRLERRSGWRGWLDFGLAAPC